jgi:hypothetical protein
MLRTAEAVKILGEKLHWVPDVPRGEVRAHAEELFSTIEIAGAHKLVVNALRTRGASAARLVGAAGFPPSLRALAYGMELSGPGIRRLLDRLTQPLSLLLGA